MKRIFAIVALSIACIGAAHAQQQTSVLNTQFPIQGTQETVDLDTAKYIFFGANPYVVDYDGIYHYGTVSLSKLQANPLWKNYVAISGFLYVNTKHANFKCVNGQTIIAFTGRGPNVADDQCALRDRILSQSNTN